MEDVRTRMEGYSETMQEIEVCRKYGTDYRSLRRWQHDAVARLHPRQLELKVEDIIQETERDRTLRLVAADGTNLPPFQAGQYINLLVDIDGVRTSRAYSISSSPRQRAYYDITVRRVEDGWVSNWLHDTVKIGAKLFSSGPAGQFHYNPLMQSPELVLLAGGSGVTPFVSMLREANDAGLQCRLHLVYGSNDQTDMLFAQELKEIALKHDNIGFTPVLAAPGDGWTGATGFINREIITEAAEAMKDPTYFICGPEAMIQHVLGILEAMGVPRRRIRREMASSLGDVTRQPGWPQEVSGQKQVTIKLQGRAPISGRCGDSLLTSLEKAGITIPSQCRSGECSLCRVKLLEGPVYQMPGALVRVSDRKYGYVHSCRTYPLDDVTIVL